MSVVAVDSRRRSVLAAMYPNNVVGEEGTNGTLWCSPVAKTSRPTSSALRATATMILMRVSSLTVSPVVGSGVTSPTVKTPNCMSSYLSTAAAVMSPTPIGARSATILGAPFHGRSAVPGADVAEATELT